MRLLSSFSEQRKDEDYDDVVEENLLDEDDQDVYILSKISDIMHALLGTHKDGALPVFQQLLPHFVKLLVSRLIHSLSLVAVEHSVGYVTWPVIGLCHGWCDWLV